MIDETPRRPIRAGVALALVLFSSCALGSEAARELVEMFDRGGDMGLSRTFCETDSGIASPRELLETNPNYFYGFGPGDELWPDVLEVYDDYNEEVCDYLDDDRLPDTLEALYDDYLDEASLRAILSFMKSPAGRKYIDATLEISKRMETEYFDAHQRYTQSASARYKERMLALRKKADSR